MDSTIDITTLGILEQQTESRGKKNISILQRLLHFGWLTQESLSSVSPMVLYSLPSLFFFIIYLKKFLKFSV